MSESIWDGTPLSETARDLFNSPPHLLAFAMGTAEAAARTMFDIDPDARQFPDEAKEAMLLFLNVRIFGADVEHAAREIEHLLEKYRNRMRAN
ncbi:hypothetical protein [Lysobacter sp. M15]|uniref:hypothetical protein n=1 Tax=Lysobacter sp. M15 TaxID=2916837 RepID=UPI001F58D907|nr:hypothetical protein [Lysobacter sp. M15]